jgi:hypothetical protein
MNREKGAAMKTRRQALALAGALTLTVITAVGAVAGMSRGASTKPAVPVVASQVVPATGGAHYSERGDD